MKTQTCDPHAVVAELRPLAEIFPQATPNWLAKTAWKVWLLERQRLTHFGGADVLAWWLVCRCQPKPPLTKAKIRKLQRMAGGSQRTMDLLVAVAEGRSTPKRLQTGWTFEQLTSYLRILELERGQVTA
jgi:hypothetical protein